MSLRTKIGLSVIHLALVVLGAAEMEMENWGFAGRAVQAYGSLSGSSAGYSFFAPGVGSPMRAVFDVTEKNGRVVTEGLGEAEAGEAGAKLNASPAQGFASREISLRVGNIIESFWDQLDDKDNRRSLAASWAGLVLARHAGARSVRVRLEQFDLPTMADYRRGAATGWEPVYEATFRRGG